MVLQKMRVLRITIDIPLPGTVGRGSNESLGEEERKKLDEVVELLRAIFSTEISEPELEAKQFKLLGIIYDVFTRGEFPKLKTPLQKMLEPAIANPRLNCLHILGGIIKMA